MVPQKLAQSFTIDSRASWWCDCDKRQSSLAPQGFEVAAATISSSPLNLTQTCPFASLTSRILSISSRSTFSFLPLACLQGGSTKQLGRSTLSAGLYWMPNGFSQ